MPSKVQLQVEVVEKNAEARLKALDKLAQEMGNRKITLNFDEASLAKWKTATDGMTNAQLSAYAKLVTASENASAKIIAAGERTTQEEMKQNTKLITERQKSIDKKIALYEKEDTKRRQAAEKTAQTEINANAKVEAAALKGANATRTQTTAQKELNTEASKTSGIFDSITQRFTAANLVSSLITAGISRLRSAVREAVTEMKEMDKQLTTIKMVSGASDSDIGNLREQAFAGARATGRSVTDYLSAAEMFTRAGYRDNIEQLSQLALMTQNIGGVEEDVASKFLLAADAAWKLGGSYESLMGVLDGVSSVADKNATDLGKIAEGITIAGSAMANAGVSAKEFTAMLGLTTASTQRSGSEMARGLRTILFRVRQVKAEFDDGEVINAEDISNAAKALKEVADIDVIDKQTNDLKSFSEIMSELADKWVDLDDKQKQYLQNALAGNRQGNVLFAWLENWDKYEQMLSQYDESAGTAEQKNEEYLKNWAAAADNLKTSWTELVGTLTNDGQLFTDVIKLADLFVRGANELVKNSAITTASQSIISEINAIGDKWAALDRAKKAGAPVDFRDYINAIGDIIWNYEVLGKTEEEETAATEKNTDATKNNTDAKTENTNATNENKSANEDEEESVDALTKAFEKQATAIDNVKKAIKEERDDAVNSMADIYKAMNEAAEKGYFGSNAFRQGGALFFSDDVLEDIKNGKKNPLKDAMDAYMKSIEEGDYSTAAANLFNTITSGSGEIIDSNGEVIASMRDLGDAYQWTFDKGEQSMGEYLSSLSDQTGLSEEFWSAMISSLGMYSDELDEWAKANKKAEDEAEKEPPTTEPQVDTSQAEKTVDDYVEKTLGKIPEKVETVLETVWEDHQGNAGSASNPPETVRAAAEANNEWAEAMQNARGEANSANTSSATAAAQSQGEAASKAAEANNEWAEAMENAQERASASYNKAPSANDDPWVTMGIWSWKIKSGAFDKPFSSDDDPWSTEAHVLVTADTSEAVSATQSLEKEIESTKPVITVTTVFQAKGAPVIGTGGGGLPATTYDPTHSFLSKYGGIFKAGGKKDNYSGIAVVNDQPPANGSTPELIISPSRGGAYIANGGRPAVVNLASDDIVLTAAETKSAFNAPGFPIGKMPLGKAFLPEMTFTGGGATDITTPKSGTGTATGSGSKKKAADPSETWASLKKLIDYLLDKAQEDLKEQLKILDDQLAEMEKERKAQEESKKLEEKQLAVQEAELDLQKAQTERTVRYYNEETQQWEWMADQKAVQDAQEAYEKALEDLNEYLDEQDYNERKAAIEAQKEDLQKQYDAYEESWKDIIDIIEAPEGDLKALLEELKKSGTDTMKGQAGSIADLLNLLREGIVAGGYALGIGRIGDNTEKSKTTAETTFDGGGLAYGLGYMPKRTAETEMVLGPDITSDILNPVKNAQFTAFADSVGSIMGGGVKFPKSQSITNNSGGNIIVNGMRIGSDQMGKPFGQVMKTLAIHVNEQR